MKKLRIGSGTGYSGYRIDSAVELLERGNLDYFVLGGLLDNSYPFPLRTRESVTGKGNCDLLEYRMKKILPAAVHHQVRIITDMGAADPVGAARIVCAAAVDLGIEHVKIAAITGDDLSDRIDEYLDKKILETGMKLSNISDRIVSINACIGAKGIIEALKHDADVIICGRVSIPSLFLAPLVYEFGWSENDYLRKGKGILAGHLLEGGSQVLGGNFVYPGCVKIENLWRVGLPIGEIYENGDILLTKLEKTAGLISKEICAEQILYEVQDPSMFVSPDCIADFSNICIKELTENSVIVSGGGGNPKSGFLEVSAAYQDCWLGFGEISYSGTSALEFAQCAGDIVRKRIEFLHLSAKDLRIEYIRQISPLQNSSSNQQYDEVCMRVTAVTSSREDAEKVVFEVGALCSCGPAGGVKLHTYAQELISVATLSIPEEHINLIVTYMEC